MVRLLSLMVLAACLVTNLHAQSKNDYRNFKNIFTQWTSAFNHKKLSASCDLFAKSVTADYRGVPTKNYAKICNGFKKVFSEQNKKYVYQFKLLNVYRSGNLAAVRIRWYLSVFSRQKLLSATQDEGMDILQKEKDERWRIINYIGYQVT